MKTLSDLVNRVQNPEPWSEGDNIPWNDPEFSERMLAEHLSQEHDLASRKTETIDRHVEWIFSEVFDSQSVRFLDLACGPGLYARRLAEKKCECVGIDFSPASIRHAQDVTAAEPDLGCTFHQEDVRNADFGEGFDIVMMIYGQFNVFQRDQGLEILKKAHAALRPGGKLLLEYQTLEQIQKGGESGPSWYSAQSGLFSESPHLVLQENFWDAEAKASTIRFSTIDAQTGSVNSYALSNEAYTESELVEAARAVGFKNVQRFPSLSGTVVSGDADLPAFVAHK
ncbi:MAG: class I SAM-dependent methyltransferase [bacterium]|nr:class I SAM-dependent methyltransferase [bacterium]